MIKGGLILLFSKSNFRFLTTYLILSLIVVNMISFAPVTYAGNKDSATLRVAPEDIIKQDIAAQQQHNMDTYLSLRTNHEVAPESIDIVKSINKDGITPNVVKADLVEIKQLPDSLMQAIDGPSQDTYRATWPNIQNYYVAINYKLNHETRWFYNGVNYRIYTLALQNNSWEIISLTPAPINNMITAGYGFGGDNESKAASIELQRLKTENLLI